MCPSHYGQGATSDANHQPFLGNPLWLLGIVVVIVNQTKLQNIYWIHASENKTNNINFLIWVLLRLSGLFFCVFP